MNTKELEHILDRAFQTEPDFHLPDDFAQKVTQSVVRREQLKNDLYEYLYLTGVLLSLLMVAGGLYYYIDEELVVRVFSFMSGNIIQVVFALFLLNFILFADRVLLRLLFSRWRMDE